MLKMRYSAHEGTLRELAPGELRVLPPAETAPGVLAAGVTQSGGTVAVAPPEGAEPAA
ncbi:MAG: hypothetical protein M3302_05640 [Actinomycetota bacterium]|nr:hypothetical protein [Actinomycetota bacterium]